MLEVAAGTGVVTRALAVALEPHTSIVATGGRRDPGARRLPCIEKRGPSA